MEVAASEHRLIVHLIFKKKHTHILIALSTVVWREFRKLESFKKIGTWKKPKSFKFYYLKFFRSHFANEFSRLFLKYFLYI